VPVVLVTARCVGADGIGANPSNQAFLYTGSMSDSMVGQSK
jgi:hypothetical protein